MTTDLILFALYNAVQILVPVICFMALAYKQGWDSPVLTLCAGASMGGVIIYTNFWVWLINPDWGNSLRIVSYIVMFIVTLKYRGLNSEVHNDLGR